MQKTFDVPELASKMNQTVINVIGSESANGFVKAYMVANAVKELKEMLTPEYMEPIMALQGNKLGFKTDKDLAKDGGKGTGYSQDIVKNCLIEAVLMGVQPSGNQFNIIASNCYITKEGFGYLLSKIDGLSYDIVPELPRINQDKSSAAIVMNITYSISGITKSKKLDIPVKMNSYMGTDAVIGKATRKARAWLYNTVTGSEIADGDISDADVVSTKINTTEPAISFEELEMLFEMKKAFLSEEDLKNAERIIKNKESNSYKKLFNTLQSI